MENNFEPVRSNHVNLAYDAPIIKSNYSIIEVIERKEKTRNPTAKRIYKTKYAYKVKVFISDARIGDIFYDIKNKISFYVLNVEGNEVTVLSLNLTKKDHISDKSTFIKQGVAFIECSLKTASQK